MTGPPNVGRRVCGDEECGGGEGGGLLVPGRGRPGRHRRGPAGPPTPRWSFWGPSSRGRSRSAGAVGGPDQTLNLSIEPTFSP